MLHGGAHRGCNALYSRALHVVHAKALHALHAVTRLRYTLGNPYRQRSPFMTFKRDMELDLPTYAVQRILPVLTNAERAHALTAPRPRCPLWTWISTVTRDDQCDMSTGAVKVRNMLRVTPPSTNSRKRE